VILGLTIENRTRRTLWYRARAEQGAGLVMEIYEGDQRAPGGLVLPPDSSEVPNAAKG
jgi:hypothetical protein